MTGLIRLFDDFLSLIFPEYCAECERLLTTRESICFLCLSELEPTDYLLRPDRNPLMLRFLDAPVTNCVSCFYYDPKGFLQTAVQTMKYRDRPQIGLALGEFFGARLAKTNFLESAVLVPVPMHKKKQRKRGYNQAEWIARGISKTTNAPLRPDLLQKVKDTVSQTRLTREQRMKNVSNVFIAGPNPPAKIALVDDVITTGSTIASAARVLHEAGAEEVIALSIAAARGG